MTGIPTMTSVANGSRKRIAEYMGMYGPVLRSEMRAAEQILADTRRKLAEMNLADALFLTRRAFPEAAVLFVDINTLNWAYVSRVEDARGRALWDGTPKTRRDIELLDAMVEVARIVLHARKYDPAVLTPVQGPDSFTTRYRIEFPA